MKINRTNKIKPLIISGDFAFFLQIFVISCMLSVILFSNFLLISTYSQSNEGIAYKYTLYGTERDNTIDNKTDENVKVYGANGSDVFLTNIIQ